MAMTSYEVGEGPDIDEENITDQDNNEVEIIGKKMLWQYYKINNF